MQCSVRAYLYMCGLQCASEILQTTQLKGNVVYYVFITLLTTTTMFIVTIDCAQCLVLLTLYVIGYL